MLRYRFACLPICRSLPFNRGSLNSRTSFCLFQKTYLATALECLSSCSEEHLVHHRIKINRVAWPGRGERKPSGECPWQTLKRLIAFPSNISSSFECDYSHLKRSCFEMCRMSAALCLLRLAPRWRRKIALGKYVRSCFNCLASKKHFSTPNKNLCAPRDESRANVQLVFVSLLSVNCWTGCCSFRRSFLYWNKCFKGSPVWMEKVWNHHLNDHGD